LWKLARSAPLLPCATLLPQPVWESWKGEILLDLCYEEDSQAEVDLNFVMTGGPQDCRSAGHSRAASIRRSPTQKKMMDLPPGELSSLIAKQRTILAQLPLRQ